jgi:hypothetical protein
MPLIDIQFDQPIQLRTAGVHVSATRASETFRPWQSVVAEDATTKPGYASPAPIRLKDEAKRIEGKPLSPCHHPWDNLYHLSSIREKIESKRDPRKGQLAPGQDTGTSPASLLSTPVL